MNIQYRFLLQGFRDHSPSNTILNEGRFEGYYTLTAGLRIKDPRCHTTSSSFSKVVEREIEVTKDTVLPTNNGSTKDVQPPVVQVQPHVLNSEPVVAPVSAPMPNLKSSIPYPSRRNDERRREKANDQIEKFYEILKIWIFPWLILALALIFIAPFIVWKKLSLPELTPTCMTLELADRSITQPIGIAEDVDVKVGKFQFLADFVVVDFDADPRSDFLLEVVDAFLALKDDPTSPKVDDSYYNPEGDILLLEAFLNDDPSLPSPT
ncbi:hypothetical protein Tco_1343083 [Tanacetum coccineum]